MIKKVVIQEKEIRYISNINEQTYDKMLYIDYRHSFQSIFKKIEGIKPLADNEVSVDDIESDNIYSFKCPNGIIYIAHEDAFSNYKFISLTYSSHCWSNSKTFKDLIECQVKKGLQIFEFSSNKQEEFLQWALDNIKT